MEVGRRLVWVARSGQVSLGRWNSNKELDDQKPATRRLGSGGWVRTPGDPRVAAVHRGGQARRQEKSSPRGHAKQGLRGMFKMFGFYQQLLEVLRQQRHDLTCQH